MGPRIMTSEEKAAKETEEILADDRSRHESRFLLFLITTCTAEVEPY